jgi:rhodanese-related sulfurtransferase
MDNKVNNMLFIDIRNSDEVFAKHFDSVYMKNYYNIPMNMIRFNVDVIRNHLQYVNKIYIVCASGSRSQFIKDKYFKDDVKIIVDKALQFNKLNNQGVNNVMIDNKSVQVVITGTFNYNLYNLTRIIQIVLGTIIISSVLVMWKTRYKFAPMVVLLAFGAMALFNGVTNTCTLSLVFRDMLN